MQLVLRRFSALEYQLWTVFSSILIVEGLIGFGFGPSFSRVLAYARAGGKVEDMGDLRDGRAISNQKGTNWTSVERLVDCMRRVFLGLGILSTVVMLTGGTLSIWKPLKAVLESPYKITVSDIQQTKLGVPSLAEKLRNPTNTLASYLRSQVTSSAFAEVQGDPVKIKQGLEAQKRALAVNLESLIRADLLDQQGRFSGIELRTETRKLLESQPRGPELIRLNRLLLEDAFPLDISQSVQTPWRVWFAWGLVIAGAGMGMWASYYQVYLQGMDHIAVFRRWETLTSLASVFSAFSVLLLGGKLLALVASNQAWMLIGILITRAICRRTDEGKFAKFRRLKWDKPVFAIVWSSAWKGGITSVMTIGLVNATTLIQAQMGNAADTGTYGFHLRIAGLLGQMCQAPFVSKLPAMARMRAAGQLTEKIALLRRGMFLAHWMLVLGTISYALLAPHFFHMIRSKSAVFDPQLWALFATNLFFERYTSMLQQVRNLTNKPMEHFGMLGYFSVNITIMLLTYRWLGMLAFPLAMLGAQLLFALWFSGLAAYRTLQVNPLVFEARLAIPAFAVLASFNGYLVWDWWRHGGRLPGWGN
jgi:hypothetical protein